MQFVKLLSRAILFLPLLEIIGFIIAGAIFGILPTLLAFIVTTLLGAFILRNYQWIAIARIQQQLRQGYVSQDAMTKDGYLILAGFLLVIPGFITDILGLLCLLPTIQSGLFKKLLAAGWLRRAAEPENTQDPRIIEGEAKRIDDEQK
ncbi:MAG: fxsA [Gammaproteobacteria bacterium]|jgi:UPF0716 protein FxsA|nr:fxsA [Gammaproteobacteria bacterium]